MNERREIIDKTAEYVRQRHKSDATGHDWWHIFRVWKNALHIADSEEANGFVVELAALLHDIGDYKLHGGNTEIGSSLAREWLVGLGVDEGTISWVCQIIDTMSFKGAGVQQKMDSIEGSIVQDADRLDAMGAIGIGRAFAYGGHTGRLMHDPELQPVLHDSFDHYRNSNGPTINHFYEKLLLLKERMNTETGRKLAEQRHQFMETFLREFFREWDGGNA